MSDAVAKEAAAAVHEHERRIHELLPSIEVRHTGGTSVRGVLTTGDVDLQVRTERHRFESARDALHELYEPLHPDAWHSDSAYFTAPDEDPPVEVALTVIGTLDDLHHGAAGQQIAEDRSLIEEYNALKRLTRAGHSTSTTPRSGSSSTATSTYSLCFRGVSCLDSTLAASP